MQTSGLELRNLISTSALLPFPSDLPTMEHGQLNFVVVGMDHTILEKSLTSIQVFLQIRQTYCCLFLIDIWHK
jgi:hypothetical protein